VVVGAQRAAGLRFGDGRVQALLGALVAFRLLPHGFRSRDLRDWFALLLGQAPERLSAGQRTYQLRRLRLHGLIVRQPHSQRYTVTDAGWRLALVYTRASNRLLRPSRAQALPQAPPLDPPLRRQFDKLDQLLAQHCDRALAGALSLTHSVQLRSLKLTNAREGRSGCP
jgi:hypothetical protein